MSTRQNFTNLESIDHTPLANLHQLHEPLYVLLDVLYEERQSLECEILLPEELRQMELRWLDAIWQQIRQYVEEAWSILLGVLIRRGQTPGNQFCTIVF